MIDPVNELRNSRPESFEATHTDSIISGVYTKIRRRRRRRTVVVLTVSIFVAFTLFRIAYEAPNHQFSYATTSAAPAVTSTSVPQDSLYVGRSDVLLINSWLEVQSKKSSCASLKFASARTKQFLDENSLTLWNAKLIFNQTIRCAIYEIDESTRTIIIKGR